MNIFSKLLTVFRGNTATRPGSGIILRSGKFDDEVASSLKTAQSRADAYLSAYRSEPRIAQAVDDFLGYLFTGMFKVMPGSTSRKDIPLAEFIEANLLQYESKNFGRKFWCSKHFNQFIFEAAFSLLVYGHAVFHKTYRKVGAYLVLDRLTYIEPRTIDRWVLDDKDDIISIIRNYRKPDDTEVKNEEIPGKDLVVLTYRLVGARYEGIGLCRCLYGNYFRKERFQKAKVLNTEKLFTPIPYLPLEADIDYSSNEFQDLEKIARQLTHPSSFDYIVAKSKPEFIQAQVGGNLAQLQAWVDAENADISAGGSSQSSSLGETATGSRGVAGVISRGETTSRLQFIKSLVDQLNYGIGGLPGLVTELVSLNFPQADKTPYLVYNPDNSGERQSAVSVYFDGVSKGALTPNSKAEAYVYEVIGLGDVITEDYVESLNDEPQPTPGQPPKAEPGDDVTKEPENEIK